MEKAKNQAIKSNSVGWRTSLALSFITIIVMLFTCPLTWIAIGDFIIPYSLLPSLFPNAFVISTESGSQGTCCLTKEWVYCTAASIEELQAFFEEKIVEFRPYDYNGGVEAPHSGYFSYFRPPVGNFLSDTFWQETPTMTLLLRRNHPRCASGASYHIRIIYYSEL